MITARSKSMFNCHVQLLQWFKLIDATCGCYEFDLFVSKPSNLYTFDQFYDVGFRYNRTFFDAIS
ncbi:hypothetical protein Hanom_Chr04g00320061 [Helianthus anomalus]